MLDTAPLQVDGGEPAGLMRTHQAGTDRLLIAGLQLRLRAFKARVKLTHLDTSGTTLQIPFELLHLLHLCSVEDVFMDGSCSQCN